MSRPKYVASCSGGKDSVATLLLAAQHNEPLDEAVFSEVMFDETMSGEVPEHRDFIYDRLDGIHKVSLLGKYGVTEAEARTLCEESGLLSPIYTHCRRNGCWFCPNASDAELRHMIIHHPEMFDRLIEWEHEENVFHRRLTRKETPSEIKARLMGKPQLGLSSNQNQG